MEMDYDQRVFDERLPLDDPDSEIVDMPQPIHLYDRNGHTRRRREFIRLFQWNVREVRSRRIVHGENGYHFLFLLEWKDSWHAPSMEDNIIAWTGSTPTNIDRDNPRPCPYEGRNWQEVCFSWAPSEVTFGQLSGHFQRSVRTKFE